MKGGKVNLALGDSGSHSLCSGQAKTEGTIAPVHTALTFSRTSLRALVEPRYSSVIPPFSLQVCRLKSHDPAAVRVLSINTGCQAKCLREGII